MPNVFTYGSLMFAPVWSRVVNGTYASCPATLHGYQRLAVKGEEYPVAVPTSAADCIAGRMYYAVNTADMQRLDMFEGDYYARLPVMVADGNGKMLAADVYVLRPEYADISTGKAWDEEHFRTVGISAFMLRYQGFG